MAYVPVPKDLTKVKTKVMFNLTRRQLVLSLIHISYPLRRAHRKGNHAERGAADYP